MSQQIVHVLVARDFPDDIIDLLRATSPLIHIERYHPDIPDHAWENVEILYTARTLPEHDQAPNLKWIQLHSAGMDHILKNEDIMARDIKITSASGIHAVPMTEYALGMMLAWNYKIPLMLDHQREKHWDENGGDIFASPQLRDKTLGIVGYGSIGRELARAAYALGMNVLATKRDVKHPADHDSYIEAGTGDPEGEVPERLYPSEALKSMASECDYLVLLTPLTEATRGMVGKPVFDAMKNTAVLVNMARGGVVVEGELINALKEGDIGGAILDVFETEPLPQDSPLWDMPNVMISPHIAGNSKRYKARAAALFAENLQRYLENRPLLNLYQPKRGY